MARRRNCFKKKNFFSKSRSAANLRVLSLGLLLFVLVFSAPASAGIFDLFGNAINSITSGAIVWNPSIFSSSLKKATPVSSIGQMQGKPSSIAMSGGVLGASGKDEKSSFGIAGMKSLNAKPVNMAPVLKVRRGELKILSNKTAVKVVSVSGNTAKIRVYRVNTIKNRGIVEIAGKKYTAVYNPKLKVVAFHPITNAGTILGVQIKEISGNKSKTESSNGQEGANKKYDSAPAPKPSFIQRVLNIFG